MAASISGGNRFGSVGDCDPSNVLNHVDVWICTDGLSDTSADSAAPALGGCTALDALRSIG